jgi:phosphopantothenoylcysteine decarboxylase/phosphopantothenate--cysteine ligase
VIVMSAAVADFRPVDPPTASSRSVTARPRSCWSRRPTSSPGSVRQAAGQVLVGFAAETDDLLANARRSSERSASI